MQTPQITQEEINSLAWKACDTFRGVVDPSEYKNYILVFLFVKYISDVRKDKYEEFQTKYEGDAVRVQRALDKLPFKVPESCTFDYIYEQRNEANIGEIINQALDAIEDANKGKLDGVFRNIDFNSESNLGQTKDRNRRLLNLINDFADPKMDLRPSHIGHQDIIGNTYEYLISRFAADAGKKGGEFYTPAEVSILLAKLLNPQPGNRIYDPCCGSGSLLIKAANEVGSRDFALYGQESNGSTWALSKMNMFLHEKDNARIEWGDTIGNPKLTDGDKLMKFDVVVANPPFSLDKWGAESAEADTYNRFWRGTPPKSKGDYAFITHMVESSVESTGKVGVIVPHGVLFRSSSEGKIRQQFIEENILEVVVGLPANLFFGTGIPAAILIFNRNKQNQDVIFIDASREYLEGKNQNKLRKQDIEKVVNTYNKARTTNQPGIVSEKYAYRATVEEIEENDYNLNIPRYVDTFEEEEKIDIIAVQKEIGGFNSKLIDLEKDMKTYLKELGILDE